jgi:hypothetical protein
MPQAHGTDLELPVFDSLYDASDQATADRVWLYDGKRSFHGGRIITTPFGGRSPARCRVSGQGQRGPRSGRRQSSDQPRRRGVTDRVIRPTPDPDLHKGALEGDRPTDKQQGNANATGLDDEGVPIDDTAIAEDVIGANEDETQG